jgi:hypothetical protein
MILIGLLLLLPLSTFISTAIVIRFQKFTSAQASPQKACFLAGLLNGSALLLSSLTIEIRRGSQDSLALFSLILYILVFVFCVNFLNWFVYTLTETSMHIHLVALIAHHKSLSQNELRSMYNKNTIVMARVPRLLQLGQLERKDGRLVLSGSWVMTGAFGCRVLRRILGIPVRPDLVK